MIYQIEYIRCVDGRSEPEVVQLMNGDYENLEKAMLHGRLIFAMVRLATEAQGFRLRKNGGEPIAHWFPGGKDA